MSVGGFYSGAFDRRGFWVGSGGITDEGAEIDRRWLLTNTRTQELEKRLQEMRYELGVKQRPRTPKEIADAARAQAEIDRILAEIDAEEAAQIARIDNDNLALLLILASDFIVTTPHLGASRDQTPTSGITGLPKMENTDG